ncbi:MAG: CsbD family protein [Terracidiphilus sp.]
MNQDRVKGIIDEVAGSAKRKAGELTGNQRLQAEGALQQVKGKAEGAWGKAKEAVQEALENTEVHLDAHVKLGMKDSTANVDSKNC